MDDTRMTALERECERQGKGILESRILGELLATPTVLLALPSPLRVAEFAAQAMLGVPGVSSCQVCLPGVLARAGGFDEKDCNACPAPGQAFAQQGTIPVGFLCPLADRPDFHIIKLATCEGLYGLLALHLAAPDAFAPYEPFLCNFGNFVALALENQLQKNLLQEINSQLHMDIAARQQAEEELRKHKESLEELVSARTAELRLANETLQREITERQRGEEELRRLNRALHTVSACNEVIVRATKEPEMLREVCQAIVALGGYRLAWVGFAVHDEAKSVRPVAQAGIEEGYLQSINFTWADTERGRGPMGTAIRTGQPVIAQNILTDPAFLPWREEAAKRGYASLIALPLSIGAEVIGALGVFAEKPGAFDEAEAKLLQELADDASFALQSLRTQVDRERAERALFESENRYRSLFEESSVPIWEEDFSEVKLYFDRLRAAGVADFRNYFELHPEEVARCASLVKVVDVNQETLRFLHVARKEDALADISRHFEKESLDIFREELLALADGKTQFEAEPPIRTLAGDIRQVILRLSVVSGHEQSLSRVHVSFTDITERKRAEEALRQSGQRLRLHVQQTPLGAVEWDTAFRVTQWNPAAEKIFGHTAAEALGQHASFIVPPAARAQVDVVWNNLLGQKGGTRSTNENVTKDGQTIFCEWYNTPLTTADGTVIGVASLVQNVTERKRAEEALQRSESSLREAQRIAHLGNWDLDLLRNLLTWSPEIYRIFELQPGEFAASYEAFLNAIHPEDREFVHRAFTASVKFRTPYDIVHRLLMKDGRIKWAHERCETHYDPQGRALRSIGTVQDITERMLADEALREAEEKLRKMADTALDAILLCDNNGKLSYWNPAAERIFGYSAREAIGQELHALLAPVRYRQAFQDGFRKFRATGLGPAINKTLEMEALRKDGTEFPVELSVSALMLAGQWCAIGIVRDVTARKQAEDALRASEEKYRAFFEQDLAGDYVSTPAGQLLDCNPAFARMFGFASVAEARSVNVASLYPTSQTREAFLKRLRDEGHIENCDMQYRRRDDSTLYALQNAVGTFNADHELTEIHGYLIDETLRRTAEAQFRQAQKMEAVGRLAGGVAHDFNNMLGVIIGYSELLLDKFPEPLPERKQVLEIKKAADRAATLTRQLLAFSRKQVLLLRVLNLNAVVEDTKKMLQRLIGEDIELIGALDPALRPVKADAGQMEQVLMNLAVNARDAMPKGGTLTIQTANVEIGEEQARQYSPMKPGAYVLLAMKDTGVGMNPETQSHLFEPFFTTKEPGKGTGLGLATVYGIVKQSGGFIWAESELGKGSAFKIYLPPVRETVQEKMPVAAAAPVPRGTETVLLAEDSEPLRKVMRAFLENSGYTVLEAGEPAEALRLAEAHPGTIHLLIADVVMPGMSGRALAEQLAALRPELKVLYVSGYTDDVTVRHGVLEAGVVFLQKPLPRDVLLKKVREILDAPAHP